MSKSIVFECGQSAIRMQLISDGEIVSSGTGTGVFHQSGGTVRAIVEGIKGSLNGLDTENLSVKSVALCSSGLPTSTQQLDLIASSLKSLVNPQHIYLAGDEVAWHLGVTGGEPGIVVSLGTGTAISVLNAQREFSVVDGWGYLLGDHGSAFEIGRMALAHCTRAFDSGAQPDYLTELIETRFGTVDAMVRHTYAHRFIVNEIAQFAQHVIAGVRAGDEACAQIIGTAMSNLATSIDIAASRMKPASEIPLYIVGGLTKGSDVLLPALTDALASTNRSADQPLGTLSMREPKGDALAGARILAETATSETTRPYLTRVTSYKYN